MKNPIFGEVSFDTGWETKNDVSLFGKEYNVVVLAAAYYEQDGITSEQEAAYGSFLKNKNQLLKEVEKLLRDFAGGNASNRFLPTTLLIKRDGGYALLCEDDENEEDGVAVCLAPEKKVVSQDKYL